MEWGQLTHHRGSPISPPCPLHGVSPVPLYGRCSSPLLIPLHGESHVLCPPLPVRVPCLRVLPPPALSSHRGVPCIPSIHHHGRSPSLLLLPCMEGPLSPLHGGCSPTLALSLKRGFLVPALYSPWRVPVLPVLLPPWRFPCSPFPNPRNGGCPIPLPIFLHRQRGEVSLHGGSMALPFLLFFLNGGSPVPPVLFPQREAPCLPALSPLGMVLFPPPCSLHRGSPISPP